MSEGDGGLIKETSWYESKHHFLERFANLFIISFQVMGGRGGKSMDFLK